MSAQLTPRFALAVASGKGGVGKSTISLNLALALVERGSAVGVLDADFYGPDIPLMVGLTRREQLRRWDLWRRGELALEPVERFGLQLMSVGFLIAEHQALALPAPLLTAALRQLVNDVEWPPLDYLVIDLPPGTGDLQQQLLDVVALSGVILVVGPQDVAHGDARKALDFFVGADVRVLGGIENMTALECPHCGGEVDVFPRVRAERSLWAAGVPALGSLAFDPELGRAGDAGRPLFAGEPRGVTARAFREIAKGVVATLERRPAA